MNKNSDNSNNKRIYFSEAQLSDAIEKHKKEASEFIKDEDKFEKLIQKLEKTLKKMPALGKYARDLAVMVSLVRSYIKKEYTDISVGTIVSIVAVIIYIVSPIDIIPDFIPGVGQLDDAALILWVLNSLHSDLDNYRQWRSDSGRQF